MPRVFCAAAFLLGFATTAASALGQTSDPSSSPTHQGQVLQVELTNTVRASSAKVGDPVKARTVTAVILTDQTVIPEGSKVVGHVQRVDCPPTSSQETVLSIAFDEFQLKHGRTLPAHLSIRAAAFLGATAHQLADESGFDSPSSSWLPSIPQRMHLNVPPAGPRNPNSQPHSSAQPETTQVDYDRGDLRSASGGTLIGMAGVSFRIDRSAGTATFQSSSRKLELKSGVQLILRVDSRTQSPQVK
jgi:hypothetical protein